MNWELGENEKLHIRHLLQEQQIQTVLEFGPGASTECMSPLVRLVHTIEESPGIYARIKPDMDALKNVRMFNFKPMYEAAPIDLLPSYDMAFVDGPVGTMRLSRLESILFAETRTEIILLHDTERKGERDSLSVMFYRGWKLTPFALCPMMMMTRE